MVSLWDANRCCSTSRTQDTKCFRNARRGKLPVAPVEMESVRHTASSQLALQKADYYAENELIEISPMVKSGRVALVCGNFGPFEPSIATRVPLWLALALKKVRRCKIIPPKWLQVQNIESVIQYERENETNLHPLPYYFSQVGAIRFLQHIVHDYPMDKSSISCKKGSMSVSSARINLSGILDGFADGHSVQSLMHVS